MTMIHHHLPLLLLLHPHHQLHGGSGCSDAEEGQRDRCSGNAAVRGATRDSRIQGLTWFSGEGEWELLPKVSRLDKFLYFVRVCLNEKVHEKIIDELKVFFVMGRTQQGGVKIHVSEEVTITFVSSPPTHSNSAPLRKYLAYGRRMQTQEHPQLCRFVGADRVRKKGNHSRSYSCCLEKGFFFFSFFFFLVSNFFMPDYTQKLLLLLGKG
jgi:hypothetical protein